MALIERLMGKDRIANPRIHVHSFIAAMGEWERGRTNRAQIVASFGLRPEDEIDLDALISQASGMSPAERFKFRTELHDVLLLAEDEVGYTTAAMVRARLGIA